MGYVSDTARNRTRNLFRLKCVPIALGHSDRQIVSEMHGEIAILHVLKRFHPTRSSFVCIFWFWCREGSSQNYRRRNLLENSRAFKRNSAWPFLSLCSALNFQFFSNRYLEQCCLVLWESVNISTDPENRTCSRSIRRSRFVSLFVWFYFENIIMWRLMFLGACRTVWLMIGRVVKDLPRRQGSGLSLVTTNFLTNSFGQATNALVSLFTKQ